MLPALGKELSDWVVTYRIKNAQLLCQLMLHLEHFVTQQIRRIIGPMSKAAMDEEPLVVEYIKLAAEYMGYFVPVDTYCEIIVEELKEANYGEITVAASLVRGSPRDQLKPHLNQFASQLGNPSFKPKDQEAVLYLIDSLFRSCQEDVLEIGEEIWKALITTLGVSAAQKITDECFRLLDEFVVLGGGNKAQVYNDNCGGLIKALEETPVWTVHCHEQFIFTALATFAGEVISHNLEQIIMILKQAMSKDTDAEVILKMVMAINSIFTHPDVTDSDSSCLAVFANSVVLEILKPLLTWRAGQSAEAVRTAGVACLITVLPFWEPTDSDLTELVPTLLSLIEDQAPTTRQLSLKAILFVSSRLANLLQIFQTVIEALLRRLDDCDKKVRDLSAEAVKLVFGPCLEKGASGDDGLGSPAYSHALLEFTYSTLLIHLDDQDTELQDIVFDTIKVVSKGNPGLLKDKVEESVFRRKSLAETLIKFIDENYYIPPTPAPAEGSKDDELVNEFMGKSTISEEQTD